MASELDKRSKRVEELEEETGTYSARLGGLNASTSPSSWFITLLGFVALRVLGDKTSLFPFCFCPPSSLP